MEIPCICPGRASGLTPLKESDSLVQHCRGMAAAGCAHLSIGSMKKIADHDQLVSGGGSAISSADPLACPRYRDARHGFAEKIANHGVHVALQITLHRQRLCY